MSKKQQKQQTTCDHLVFSSSDIGEQFGERTEKKKSVNRNTQQVQCNYLYTEKRNLCYKTTCLCV